MWTLATPTHAASTPSARSEGTTQSVSASLALSETPSLSVKSVRFNSKIGYRCKLAFKFIQPGLPIPLSQLAVKVIWNVPSILHVLIEIAKTLASMRIVALMPNAQSTTIRPNVNVGQDLKAIRTKSVGSMSVSPTLSVLTLWRAGTRNVLIHVIVPSTQTALQLITEESVSVDLAMRVIHMAEFVCQVSVVIPSYNFQSHRQALLTNVFFLLK